MKVALQNYTVIIAIKTSYTKFSNKKIVYKSVALPKGTEFYKKWFVVCTTITSKFRYH
jgi:predicted nucleic-acid-binding Zn-ribbon protein